MHGNWKIVPLVEVDDSGWTPYWVLTHVPCGWVSNRQNATDKRNLEDILRWIQNHQCPAGAE